jgi:protein TonB
VRECATWAIAHVSSPDLHIESLGGTPPAPLKITKPQYPEEALQKKVEGVVTVEVLISETGTVVIADIRQSIPALDAAVLRRVREWTFRPALREGKPVPAVARAPVAFRIY